MDDLRKLGLEKDLPIPQVAVMGDQSSGKSSVLEAISGIPFPRGTGLVTRCATQRSMSHGSKYSASIRAGKTGTPMEISSNSKMTAMIESSTQQLCGKTDFCTDEVIEIKLRSPGSPDLTLIDLPGIVRTTTDGQDAEVIGRVDRLLKKYIAQERAIVLAVIPATSDIATGGILQMASEADPGG